MPDQQYTCPKCGKDYFWHNISLHYECGVEPLDAQSIVEDEKISDELVKELQEKKVELLQINEIKNPIEPKKRGRKPKTVNK